MLLFWLSWLFMPKENSLTIFHELLLRHSLVSLLTCLPFLRVEPYFSHLGIRDYGDHPMIVLILSAIILKRMRKRMVAYYLRTNGHGISYIIR
jgi:hypothetical protein